MRSYIDYQVMIWASKNYETAYYRIRAYDTARLFSDYTPERSIAFHILLKTLLSASDEIPTRFELLGNFPNPFNPSTTIKYAVPKNVHVTIKLYNTLGAEVVTLVNEEKPAGFYDITFDGSRYASGVYFYKMTAGEYTKTKKLILMK